jgi:hypothetical protein
LADVHVIAVSREDEEQRAVHTLNNVSVKYNFIISVYKNKPVAVKGKMIVRIKILVNNNN